MIQIIRGYIVRIICLLILREKLRLYGCLPENIHAAIGPSIGPDNYEVDEGVIKSIVECPYLDTTEDNVIFDHL